MMKIKWEVVKKKKEERNKIKKKFGERSGILIEKVE